MEDVLEDLVEHSDDEVKHGEPFGCVHVRHEMAVPSKFCNGLSPKNDAEQKERFFKWKVTPEFKLETSVNHIERALLSQNGRINFNLFREAKRILELVLKQFRTIDSFVEASYGPLISVERATEKVVNYIRCANFPTPLEVIWCQELIGRPDHPHQPNERRFTVILKSNQDNTYLREQGICSLMDHELGTHYLRSYNEGTQEWYMKRKEFGLCPISSCEMITIEEGLACLHTAFHGRYPFLGIPALLYYGACMAEYLTFKDLYQHLSKYVKNEGQLWKHCMRIKRCLASQNDYGGYGKDQRYFEGAVTVLREQENIDFTHLMSGKLTIDDLDRSRSFYSTENIRLPYFMQTMADYRARLREMARLNGITLDPARGTETADALLAPNILDDDFLVEQLPKSANLNRWVKNTLNKRRRGANTSPCADGAQEVKGMPPSRRHPSRQSKLRSASATTCNRKPAVQTPHASRPTPESPIYRTPSKPCQVDPCQFPNRYSYLEGLDFVDMTPVSIIRSRHLIKEEYEEFERREDKYLGGGAQIKRAEGKSFDSLVQGCGCNLFTNGCISVALGDGEKDDQAIPILLEIDMRHPVLDANQ